MHYSRLPDGDLKLALVRWSDERLGDAKPRGVGDVMTCLGSLVHVPYNVEQPAHLVSMGTTKPNWLAMRNGIFDLGEFAKSGKAIIHPHTAKYFASVALPYAYDAQAECNTWFRTLDSTFDGDEERADLLAEWFGYCLTDDTSQQAILVCEGPKPSGKGTVFRTLRQTVGADKCVSPRLFSLGEMFGLMGLVDTRVALCPDAHLGHGDRALGVLETLKLISGEDAVEFHRKHRDPITIRLRVKIALAVNELPKFGDSAGALASRVLILPFRRTF